MKDIAENWKKEEVAAFKGWDFSRLKSRTIRQNPPWDYVALARKLVARSNSVLDMGTGGGEVFSSLAPFRKAVATEGYRPNYLIAKKRLAPLGVKVVDFANSTSRKLPFKSGEFDLVLNRHDAFNIPEVFRVLGSGTFLTQQVGKKSFGDMMKFFHAKPQFDVRSFDAVKKMLKEVGFTIRQAREWEGTIEFKDVGAIVYFLSNVPWIVRDFSVDAHLEYLLRLQERIENGEKLSFGENLYIIRAEKA